MTSKNNFLREEIAESLHNGGIKSPMCESVGRFAQNSVALLLEAHQQLLQDDVWKKFIKKNGAWTSGENPRLKETALSADLARNAQELLEAEGTSYAPHIETVGAGLSFDVFSISCVVADEGFVTDELTGSNSPRADIVFHPAVPELKIRFSAEAKIVESEADVTGKLFGPEGLGCYTRFDNPYQTSGAVWLLAYSDASYIGSAMACIEDHMTGHDDFSKSRRAGYVVDEATVSLLDAVCADVMPGIPSFCFASAFSFPVMRKNKKSQPNRRALKAK
ncbi:TPA: hypothetical protein ACU9T0_005897 [Burkholderia cenocepacia]